MKTKNKFWVFALASLFGLIISITLVTYHLWGQLEPDQQTVMWQIIKGYTGYLFIILILASSGIGFVLDFMVNTYIIPLAKLVDEALVISTVNPSHRIKLEGAKNIVRLVEIINTNAERMQQSDSHEKKLIVKEKAQLEEEKNTLAAVISGLPEGVVICNVEGQILLYNKRARLLLSRNGQTDDDHHISARLLGLGRSVFGVVDKYLIIHALDEMTDAIEQKKENIIYQFIIPSVNNVLLRIQAIPILRDNREMYGFILVLYDITQIVRSAAKRDVFLESLTVMSRSSIGAIRAAIETMAAYPDMQALEQEHLQKVILDESVVLSRRLDRVEKKIRSSGESQWPLDNMRCSDLAEAVKKKAEEKLEVSIILEKGAEDMLIKGDHLALVYTICFLIAQLKETQGIERFVYRTQKDDRFLLIDLIWPGRVLSLETLRQWQSLELMIQGEGLPLPMKDVLERHGAEIWPQSESETESQTESGAKACLRLLFPSVSVATEKKRQWRPRISLENRPEFYDFDLFNQPGQIPDLDNLPLAQLRYTVFDTETTGLNPSGGDEIISVGALRIINNRLLHEEYFDQLVNPQRPLPPESIRFHGIQPEMLEGQPTIENVLPQFQRFAEDTVMVAHNAAFDMRMLQIKEAPTGIRFINPVLDTLLLSAVVHPSHTDHNIEDIAQRLGIRVVGRHTALGDAIATAEIFIKLIPLLEQKGIRTLKQARLSSKKTYYARLKY
ncbi:exonuclease domain-containing protein [Desulfococcaceae bacterium HSG9]|nr:exonuclease domain-containing protein [Desulfococcaceae bacterium HSG9]